jgi:hypothetical protein
MKSVFAFVLVCVLAGCANKQNEAMQDPGQVKADIKAREEFAKTLPKPPER